MLNRKPPLRKVAVTTFKVAAIGALLLPVLFLFRLMNPPIQSQAMALADLDGDGDLDAFVANGEHEDFQPNTVLWNDGAGRFRDSGQRLGHGGSVAVLLHDMNADGTVDALVSNSGWFDTFWNDGDGHFSEPEFAYTPSIEGMYIGLWRTQAADLNGDGHDDIFLAGCCGGGRSPDDPVNPYNTVWLSDGDFLRKNSGQTFGQGSTHAIALADFDGDGDLDAFGANSFMLSDSFDLETAANNVWFNNGDGRFVDSAQRLGDLRSYHVAAGDLDADGDIDVLVGNDGPDEIWWNDGQGNFTRGDQTLGDGRTQYVHVADLNGDDHLDAFTGDCNKGILHVSLLADACRGHLWLNDGSGAFHESRQSVRYSFFHSVALGDLNGDDAIDIVAARFDDARVWLNDGTGRMR